MSPYRTINVSKLTPGDTLGEPVFQEGLTKLLGAGCTVNEQLISRLAERGVTEVVVQIPAAATDAHPRRYPIAPSYTSTDIPVDSSRRVEHSCQCGSVIAIEPPSADHPVSAWICKSCGAAYFGGMNVTNTRGVEMLKAVSVSALAGEGHSELIRADSLAAENDASASNSALDTLTGKDRRQQTRYSLGVAVVAVPLHANFSIAGPAVRMTTKDISQSGVALTHARFSEVPYYVIDFTAAGMELLQVLVQVLRVRNNGPTYELAGKFINRLHCTDWHN
jgi:hypothetical protein